MKDRISNLLAHFVFPGTSVSGAVVTNVESIEVWVRLSAGVIGIVSGMVAIYWMWRLNTVKMQNSVNALCEACRAGNTPPVCPVPRWLQPKDCPHKQK